MSEVANTLWARSFTDELARHGVREIVLAPGSRSTPLVMACARDDRLRLRVHLDERSAAFFALGVGKATERPAVVLTTSGTAAANVFPAVIEASMGGVPLLVLTADRPHHLRDSDANQAIDQVGLYGGFVRESFDLALPTLDGPALRHLRALAARVVAGSVGPTAGPVHVNFPFDKPLEPLEADADFAAAHPLAATGREGGAPFVEIATAWRRAADEELEALVDTLDSPRGVIVAGPTSEPERSGCAVLDLAGSTGFPVLADPLSGARYGPAGGAHRVAAYDLFLADPEVASRLEPSLIVRVGASPTSASLQRWLQRHDGVTHVVVDDGRRWKDHGATATRYVRADAASTLTELSRRSRSASADEWCEAWRAAESSALSVLAADDGESHEGDVFPAILTALPSGAGLFVSSSMPVRDLDTFGHPREERLDVWGNRGASGIDGIVSTAFGIASQCASPTVCVIGDVAFFHDQNGLLWSRERDAPVVFVLVDNDGGGIFHMLPIAEHEPHFTEYFATPHGLDLSRAAELHGIVVRETTLSDLERAVREAVSTGTTALVRVRTDRKRSQARREEIRESVGRSVQQALAPPD